MAKSKDLDPLDTFLEATLASTETPTHFGPFAKVRPLGQGAHGEVWEVTDPAGRAWALKALRQVELIERFQREVDKLASLDHPHILKLHDADLDFTPPYFVCPLLIGGSLKDRLAKGPLSLPDTYRLARELASALVTLEQQGLIHRDIKPANLLLDQHGTLHLADFGIVKRDADSLTTTLELTRTGQSLGTTSYMSPEQLQGQNELSTKLDIFAFGIVLYECLTGQRPFAPTEKTRDLISAAILRDAPQSLPPSVPAELARLIFSCLEKNPAKRPGAGKIWEKLEKIGKKPTASNDCPLSPPTISTQSGARHAMNTAATAISQSLDLLRSNAIAIPAAVTEALARISAPSYKVAVVGKFQVGKSTLINKVFIKADTLLKEGHGIPCSAVATEVVYGPEPKLEVFDWQKVRSNISGLDGEQHQFEQRGDAMNLVETIAAPTAADISRLTTGKTKEERTALAARVGCVRLSWPCESLRRFSIYDTPGIEDPDRDLLLNTTYQILPQADVALLVVSPTQLDGPVLDFLQSRVFEAGLSRLMILVSYNPDNRRSANARQEILENIRSQLNQIGRGYIPVEMICYDASVDGQILNTPEAIEKRILSFIDDSALKGRIEKAANLTRASLQRARLFAQTEVEALGKSEVDRQAMLKDTKAKIKGVRDTYEIHSVQFLNALHQSQNAYRDRVMSGLDRIARTFTDGFDACNDLPKVQSHLHQAEAIMRPQLEDLFFKESQAYKAEVLSLAKRFNDSFKHLPEAYVCSGDIKVDGGFIAGLPPWLVTVADYLLMSIPLPGGAILGSFLRWILGRFETISRFMPTNLLAQLLAKNAKASVDQQFAEVKGGISQRLGASLNDIESRLAQGFEGFCRDELEPLAEIIAKAQSSGAAAVQRQQTLQSLLSGITQAEADLKSFTN